VGSSFDFGGGGAVTVPALGHDLDSFTVEAWVRRTDLLSDPRPILHFGTSALDGVHLWQGLDPQANATTTASGALFANLVDNTGVSHLMGTPPGALTNNEWNHVALVYDQAAGVARVYVNGALVTAATVGSFTPLTSLPFNFGNQPSTGRSFWRHRQVGSSIARWAMTRSRPSSWPARSAVQGRQPRALGRRGVEPGHHAAHRHRDARRDRRRRRPPSPPASVTVAWTQVTGPATVTFGTPGTATITATFRSRACTCCA